MIDDIDLKILGVIHQEARVTIATLAKRVNLSATRCWRRFRILEITGVIQRYVAVIDNRALGYNTVAIVEISLNRHDPETHQKFEAELAKIPEIFEACRTTGEHEYLLKIALSNVSEFDLFLRERLHQIPCICVTRVRFVLRSLLQNKLPEKRSLKQRKKTHRSLTSSQ